MRPEKLHDGLARAQQRNGQGTLGGYGLVLGHGNLLAGASEGASTFQKALDKNMILFNMLNN
jgi:hypothetical protein